MRKYFLLKKEIEAFEDALETIKASEKISAARIHSLKERNSNLAFYKQNLEKIISRFLLFFDYSSQPFFRTREGKEALVIVTSNKGLVGGLWHKIVEETLNIRKNYDYFFCLGSKGVQYLEEEGVQIERSFPLEEDIITLETASRITACLLKEFEDRPLSRIDIIYPHFASFFSQKALLLTFLPFSFLPEFLTQDEEVVLGFPLFEPKPKEIFRFLSQKYFEMFFYQILIEAKLSEFTARTIFLENASFRGESFLKKLRMNYFKQRKKEISQAQIESFTVHQLKPKHET